MKRDKWNADIRHNLKDLTQDQIHKWLSGQPGWGKNYQDVSDNEAHGDTTSSNHLLYKHQNICPRAV